MRRERQRPLTDGENFGGKVPLWDRPTEPQRLTWQELFFRSKLNSILS
jgi:hypothetical protein